jgi:hypothetical protein
MVSHQPPVASVEAERQPGIGFLTTVSTIDRSILPHYPAQLYCTISAAETAAAASCSLQAQLDSNFNAIHSAATAARQEDSSLNRTAPPTRCYAPPQQSMLPCTALLYSSVEEPSHHRRLPALHYPAAVDNTAAALAKHTHCVSPALGGQVPQQHAHLHSAAAPGTLVLLAKLTHRVYNARWAMAQSSI